MKALILSGGSGTRLRPLTYTHAKQLVPVANKPTLFYILEKVADAGIKDIGIIVGNTGDEIKTAIGTGEKWSVNVTYIYQSLPLGLAHAVKLAAEFVTDDDFIMILGDNLFSMDLDSLLESFYANDADACLMLHKVENPQEYGVAVIENNLIVKLVEKPQEYIGDMAITGVYVFNKRIFDAIHHTKPSPRGELEITDAIQELLNIGGTVTYVPTSGWWKDTGKLKDILEANRYVLSDIEINDNSCIGSNSYITNKVQVGKNVHIDNSIIRGPVIIGDNCTLSDCYVGPFTSIGKDSMLRNCELENCIILESCRIEDIDKRIDSSLIGKNVKIKGISSKPSSINLLIGDHCEVYL